jgi:valyl-tRNA synthetase
VHRAPWPVAAELPADGNPAVVTAAAEVLAAVRKAKSDAKQSMRADVETATVAAAADRGALVEAARADLVSAGRIAELLITAGDGPLTVAVVLAPVALG